MPEATTAPTYTTIDLDRRKFLKLAGYSALGTAAVSALPASLQAAAGPKNLVAGQPNSETAFWQRIQQAFVLDPHAVYMNIGTTGSTPRLVLKNYNAYNHLVAKDPWHMGGEWGDWPYVSELVNAIAPQFGADPHEIVLSRNTTDGMCTVLGGLNFKQGDHILTTHHEHIAATSPLKVVQERFGVVVEEVEIPVLPEKGMTEDDFEEQMVGLFTDAITPATRLIVLSHVTYKTGTRLPVERICTMAKDHGIATLIDGAHTPGMLNLNFHDIDCDFYAGSGHKWQCGPGATGILYIRNDNQRLKEYWFDRAPVFWPINGSLYPFSFIPTFAGIATQLQYVGNDNYPAKRALADVCEMWAEIGRQRIEDYVLGLSAHCKQRIQEVFGDRGVMYSPNFPKFASGLTAFNPFEDQTDSALIREYRDRLREEYGFIIRYTNFKIKTDDKKDIYAMRISTHLFNDFQQVDDLVEAMYDLYQKI